MPLRTYRTSITESMLWQDLEQLAQEQAVLMWFREPEYRYAVDTQPPNFLIRKARPTKWSTEFWIQIRGHMETQGSETVVMMRPGYTDDGQMRLGLSGLFLLAWPPLWFMLLSPSTWVWSMPLTLFLGGFIGLNVYIPVRRFHRFLIHRWQLQQIDRTTKPHLSMKKTFMLSFCLLLGNSLRAQEMVRIVRWVSPVTGDFETLREDLNPDAQLQGWGYKDKLYQFSAYKTRPNDPNATAVNRWVMPNCAASIVIAEHEIPEATLQSWGYKDKEFQFYAFRTKPASGDFVAVNRWINAKTQGDKCRDFTLTVAETELTDAQLIAYGYTEKKTQFYVPRPGSSTSSNSNTAQTIRLEDINEWLCPNQRTRGDGEFDGHGPRIKSEVRLRVGDSGRSLYADITFWAQETQHDWSTAEGRWSRKVYEAPYGKRISRIVSDRASRTQFISPPGGSQFLFPGNDVAGAVNGFLDGLGGGIANAIFALHGIPPGNLNDFGKLVTRRIDQGNTVCRVPAIEGTLVKFFSIVGDTGGGDISDDDNCNDDTRIVGIEFAPAKVEFVNQQN